MKKKRFHHSGRSLHSAYSGRMVFWEGGGLFAVDYEEFFEEHECQIQQAAQRAKENVKGLDSSTSTHGNTKGILSMSEICATECNRNSSNGICYRNI